MLQCTAFSQAGVYWTYWVQGEITGVHYQLSECVCNSFIDVSALSCSGWKDGSGAYPGNKAGVHHKYEVIPSQYHSQYLHTHSHPEAI